MSNFISRLKNLKLKIKPEVSFDFFFIFLLLFLIYPLTKKYIFDRYDDFYIDENWYVTDGFLFLKGLVPYKDFFENKPIMIVLINALSILIFGLKNCAFKIMPVSLVILSAVLFYLSLVKIRILRFFSFAIAFYAAYMILHPDYHDNGINDTETLGFVFALLSFSSFFGINKLKIKKLLVSHFCGGIFFALSLLSKEPFLISLSPLLLFTFIEEKPFKVNYSKLVSLISGAGSIFLVFFLYLLITGAFLSYVDIFLWNLAYSSQYTKIVNFHVPDSFFQRLQYDWEHLYGGYKNFNVFMPLVIFYVAALFFNKLNLKIILCVFGIFCGLYSVSMGHLFWRHYYLIGIFPFIVPAILGAKNFSDYLSSSKENKTLNHDLISIVLIIAAYSICTFTKPAVFLNEYGSSYSTVNIGDKLDVFKSKVLPVIGNLTSKKDKVLLVGYPNLYILADRLPATKYITPVDNFLAVNTLNQSSEKRKKIFIEELNKNKPKIIYLQPQYPFGGGFISQYITPFISENNYFNCGNNLYLRNTPSDSEKEIYCEPNVEEIKLNLSTSLVSITAVSNNEHSDQWKASNAVDGLSYTDWAVRGNGPAVFTVFLKRPANIKSIWLYARQPYATYQSWEKLTAKFYFSETLRSAQEISLPEAYRRRMQKANPISVYADKIELYFSDADAVKKKPNGEPSEHPIDSGYTEILVEEIK
ncbi:MAG: hypothetical protein A3B68_05490 [Candidatus Melainabacteria bacterium RIFCSPHIGHO2_02_FULL_34_12]|nr:MAG: hypothetical protein A3B68_05490 [Candidatus Melainabacteria bacterium RIFCSPHIGHO2_02_FULL_34_12]